MGMKRSIFSKVRKVRKRSPFESNISTTLRGTDANKYLVVTKESKLRFCAEI